MLVQYPSSLFPKTCRPFLALVNHQLAKNSITNSIKLSVLQETHYVNQLDGNQTPSVLDQKSRDILSNGSILLLRFSAALQTFGVSGLPHHCLQIQGMLEMKLNYIFLNLLLPIIDFDLGFMMPLGSR